MRADLAPRAGSTTPLLDTASRSNSRAGVSRQASLAKDSAEPAASNDFPATSPGPKDSRMADMAEDAGGGVGEEADGAAVGWGGCQCQLHAARAVCSALVRDASLRAPFCKAGGLNVRAPATDAAPAPVPAFVLEICQVVAACSVFERDGI